MSDSETESERDDDSETIKKTSNKRDIMDPEALQDLDGSADDQYSHTHC